MSKTKWTDGWLCRNEGEGDAWVAFHHTKPPEKERGMWCRFVPSAKWWKATQFRRLYGPACLPQPGEMMEVEIEL